MKIFKWYRLLIFCLVLLSISIIYAAQAKQESSNLTLRLPPPPAKLPTQPVTMIKRLTSLKIANSTLTHNLSLNEGFGSGAYHLPSDPPNIFYTITDRGPVISCKDSKKGLGIKHLCPQKKGKIFLLPEYTPTIYKVRLDTNIQTGSATATIIYATPLRDSYSHKLSGIPNPSTSEKAYDKQGVRIPFKVSGVDPEALVRMSNGSFWVAEEYGPSLLHVSPGGKIINRIIPPNALDELGSSPYPVHAGLAEITGKRILNRGIEALALSRDETQLFFMLQSPLAHPNKSTGKKSRHIRIFRYSLDANGQLGDLTGEFIYTLDKPKYFIYKHKKPDRFDISVTDMSALNQDKLLVVERSKKIVKLYKIDLKSATNIAGLGFDGKTLPTLEATKKLDSLNITPVTKKMIYSTLTDYTGNAVTGKIEGLAVLDKHRILLINDNDFGIKAKDTKIQILTTKEALF